MDEAEERFERDYAMGRRAGMTDAILFIWAIVEKLPKDQRRLVVDTVIGPLHEESKHREQQS